jgi:PleD family two-component response regulator
MGAEILAQHGLQVFGITDGTQFRQALADFNPDLVLVDVCLPSLSGYEICRDLKSDPARRHVKVAFLVGPVDPFDPAEASRAGVDAIVQKPLESSAVRQILDRLLAPAPPNALERAVQHALHDSFPNLDPDRLRAAVVLAVEGALPRFLDELTRRIVDALSKDPSRPHAG